MIGRSLALLLLGSTLCGAADDHEVFSRMYRNIIASESGYYVPDRLAGLLHRPDQRIEVAWAEHASGRLTLRTDRWGFREDRAVPALKPAGTRRVLVTGDSHADGLVDNAESFANLMEAELNRRSRGRAVEVINGGVGHYGLHNYAGFLRRHLFIRPDVFIVAVYAGNDFLEAAEFLELREGPPRPKPYAARLAESEGLHDPAVWQGLNQLVYFKHAPAMKARVLSFAREKVREIRDVCRRRGIALFFILLPAKIEVETPGDPARLQRALAPLDLSEADRRINSDLRRELAAILDGETIAHWDAGSHPPSPRPAAPLYWDKDFHLSREGHRWIASGFLKRHGEALLQE